MKKILICSLLLLCLCFAAHAEASDPFFTRSEDFYYHYNPRCGGEEGRVPISAEAAAAFGKYLCRSCHLDYASIENVRAVARGGTIVVEFSDAWLNEHELSGVFGFMSEECHPGVEGQRMLREYLHGEDYNAFLDAWLQDGQAEGRANTPYILPVDGTIVMNRRHIGGNWYIIVRPQGKFGKTWQMYWRISSLALRAEGEDLYSDFDLQTEEDYYALKLQNPSEETPVYSRSGEIAMEVYRDGENHIAVIREADADPDQLQNVQLRISGRNDGIELNGYMDGRDAIYCCMLTDAELEALKGNARLELRRTEYVRSEVYRVEGEGEYSYYSERSDELLFAVEKLNGMDPVDDDWRFTLDGDPHCFVVQEKDAPAIYRYTESGRERIALAQDDPAPQRITPLLWHDAGGVFLAESYKDPTRMPEEKIFADGIEFEVRIGSAPEDEWASYHCYLLDDHGERIGKTDNQAFTVLESGQIIMEGFDGNTWIYNPPIGD